MSDRLAAHPRLREPVILDENGRQIAITRRTIAAPNPRSAQTHNSHPAIGLTVDGLLGMFRQAEQGNPLRQMDLFDDLRERDGELRGMLNDRNEDVAGWDFEVIPPAGRTDKASVIAAASLNERLQSRIDFRQFVSHQLNCIPDGYACTNLQWDIEENLVIPSRFVNVAPRRFASPRAELAHELYLIDPSGPTSYVELEPGLWATSRYRGRNPYAAGLMRSCTWWTYFKLTGWKGFNVWLAMFGMPLSIGYYEESASGASREALEDAVRSIGQDGYAVLSAATEVVIKEVQRGGGDFPHLKLMTVCDAINTKLVTGGTLNTDVSSTGAGSYNAATVHKSRLDAMKRHDARIIEEMFVRDIGQTFIAWNGFDRAAPPRLKIKIPWGDLERAKTLEIIGSAIPLSASQMYEEFSCRIPDKGDEVMFQPTPLEDPGRGKTEKNK